MSEAFSIGLDTELITLHHTSLKKNNLDQQKCFYNITILNTMQKTFKKYYDWESL